MGSEVEMCDTGSVTQSRNKMALEMEFQGGVPS